MINVKPEVVKQLKKAFKNINDGYPEDWAVFPVIQYTEEENSTNLKTDDKEQRANIRYRFDIWHNRSTSEIAIKLDELISSLGLVRVFAEDVPDPSHLRHKVMRYEGIIDVNNLRIYN